MREDTSSSQQGTFLKIKTNEDHRWFEEDKSSIESDGDGDDDKASENVGTSVWTFKTLNTWKKMSPVCHSFKPQHCWLSFS